MKRKDKSPVAVSFTLTKAGCVEGPAVSLTSEEFSDLTQKRQKIGPKTKAQSEVSALFSEFVKRGMGR